MVGFAGKGCLHVHVKSNDKTGAKTGHPLVLAKFTSCEPPREAASWTSGSKPWPIKKTENICLRISIGHDNLSCHPLPKHLPEAPHAELGECKDHERREWIRDPRALVACLICTPLNSLPQSRTNQGDSPYGPANVAGFETKMGRFGLAIGSNKADHCSRDRGLARAICADNCDEGSQFSHGSTTLLPNANNTPYAHTNSLLACILSGPWSVG